MEVEKEEARKEVHNGIYKHAGLPALTAKFRTIVQPTRPDDAHLS